MSARGLSEIYHKNFQAPEVFNKYTIPGKA